MTITLHIEEEVNYSQAAENTLYANKPRDREEATTTKKDRYKNQPQARDEAKDVGDQATTDPTNRFSEASRGHKQKESQTRNKQKEYRCRK